MNKGDGQQHIEIILRARDGITKALEEVAGAQAKGEKSMQMCVDGPYGHAGLASDLLAGDDADPLSITGATFTIPVLIDLVPLSLSARAVRVSVMPFTVTSSDMSPTQTLEGSDVSLYTHVNRQDVEEIDPERGDSASDGDLLHNGRSNILELILCGPDEFAHDVRGAVAAEQMVTTQGHCAVAEVFLHAENYR
ncbi:hypothetical protein FB451DRAFT_1396901 [Mycena latifolia]|nr:hypothetical protein FB451DRAFT_1396901 [Mycena latifolia]